MSADFAPTPRFVDGGISYWWRDLGEPACRAPLAGDTDADVAIVGAGYTGLWTAYYLKAHQPDLRIVMLEKEFAGFGASGRNGGWLSAEPPGQLGRYARAHGRESAVRLQRAMFHTVDEVIAVAGREGIDAHIVKDGYLQVATNPAQQRRLAEHVPHLRAHGWAPEDLQLIDAAELGERVRIPGASGALFSRHCARIHPARLARGLAEVVERSGVTIAEETTVTQVLPGQAVTDHGTVRAQFVLRALEGFTSGLEGHRREWLPMASSMVVTEPFPSAVWNEIGWRGAELLSDEAHAFAYVQQTRDGRIALGGRAVPYRYGSQRDARGETLGNTVEQLREVLGRLFPAARGVGIDHGWSGVLGVPRDWCATVAVDAATGLGHAGGYVGHGVASTNLAGRTLADLVLRRDSDLVTLPWVGRTVRRWEPEPLRWLGVRGLYAAYRMADRQERGSASSRTSPVAHVADRISGRAG
ncbi:MAG: FAD-binding oxidoreductase [Intrasporangium sp.]|uniref:NAD(P)/FAD-dependent oxidoreductase n=1 Tax=Intrasporangium sp. TaxID=1925024 RepID=UPI002647B394|nr:FAD-binding oxidoreductase [Intrasporangium sp.]MDN5795768.1 FAD-binding oxidoreductase [Intrasporangium sp.]